MSHALKSVDNSTGNPLLSVFCSDNTENGGRETYTVQYLGNIETVYPVGEAMCGSVEEIYENARKSLQRLRRHNYRLPKMTFTITDDNFELRPMASEGSDTSEVRLFSLKRITYCGVDRKRNKTFAFNYHEQEEGERKPSYRTHAILCSDKEVARRFALVVAEYFRESNATGQRRNPNKTSRTEVLRGFNCSQTTGSKSKADLPDE